MTLVLKSLTHLKQGVGLIAKNGICKENSASEEYELRCLH